MPPQKRQRIAPPISHATRIEPTNYSYKDLLRKHQFTPSGGSASQSPLKKSFADSLSLTTNNFTNSTSNNPPTATTSPLAAEREAFRKRPIIEEPKKNVSGYQLFARWKRINESHTIPSGLPQTKALSIAWNDLPQTERDEWSKKSEQAKIEYYHQKELWLKYVEEAKRLGIPVPQKSVKPIFQPIKIKNLLNLIPNISKFNKETQFLISKATEMFIQFYASKAIDVSGKVNKLHYEQQQQQQTNNSNNEQTAMSKLDLLPLSICGQHCYDALHTDHKLNFLRAVTVKPTNLPTQKRMYYNTQMHSNNSENKRGLKRKSNEKSVSNNDIDHKINIIPLKKRRTVNVIENNDTTNANTNQTVATHEGYPATTPMITTNSNSNNNNMYPPMGYVNTFFAPNAYSNYYVQPSYMPQTHFQANKNQTKSPFPSIPTLTGQTTQIPPNPFQATPFYEAHPMALASSNNNQSQIINEQQIFGED